MVQLNDVPARGLTPLQSKDKVQLEIVNIPATGHTVNLFGVTETEDVVRLFYKAWETYRKVREDGKINFADLPNIISLITLIPAALSGSNLILPEIKDLQFATEAEYLINLADGFDLGEDLPKAKAACRMLLTSIHSFNIFLT
jgi:hypothetical protein